MIDPMLPEDDLINIITSRLGHSEIMEVYGVSSWRASVIRHALGLSRGHRQFLGGYEKGSLLAGLGLSMAPEGPVPDADKPTTVVDSQDHAEPAPMVDYRDQLAAAGGNPDEWVVTKLQTNEWGNAKNPQTKAWWIKAPKILTNPEVVATPYPAGKGASPGARVETMALIPDTQIGFVWNNARTQLLPYHDMNAMCAVLEWLADVQPDWIVHMGDAIDLPMFSRWPKDPVMAATSNAAVYATHWFCKSISESCPNSRRVFLGGNHDRFEQDAARNMPELLNLTHPVTGEPICSIEHILSLAPLGWEYVRYKSGVWFPSEQHPNPMWLTHGEQHGSKAAQVIAKMLDGGNSMAQGHDHKVGVGSKTMFVPGGDGLRRITGICPGTLSRIDRHSQMGRFKHHPGWSQGAGFVQHFRDTGHISANAFSIERGRLYTADGRVYQGDPDAAAAILAERYPQIAEGHAVAQAQMGYAA